MGAEKALASLDLFATEVAPKLRGPAERVSAAQGATALRRRPRVSTLSTIDLIADRLHAGRDVPPPR